MPMYLVNHIKAALIKWCILKLNSYVGVSSLQLAATEFP